MQTSQQATGRNLLSLNHDECQQLSVEESNTTSEFIFLSITNIPSPWVSSWQSAHPPTRQHAFTTFDSRLLKDRGIFIGKTKGSSQFEKRRWWELKKTNHTDYYCFVEQCIHLCFNHEPLPGSSICVSASLGRTGECFSLSAQSFLCSVPYPGVAVDDLQKPAKLHSHYCLQNMIKTQWTELQRPHTEITQKDNNIWGHNMLSF